MVRSSRFSGTRQQAWGLQGERQPDHLGRGGHFEVQRHEELPLEALHVEVPDMPPILPQMRRDAVGAGENRQMGRPDRVGIRTAAGIPHGGHMVDVHAEAKRWCFHRTFLAHRRFLPNPNTADCGI